MARQATEDDARAVYDLLAKHMHPESGIDLPPVDPMKTAGTILRAIAGGGVAVEERDGAIVGSIGLSPNESWWSVEPSVIDLWFYVHPDARASRAAVRLLRWAKDWAGERKLIVGVYSGVDLQRKTQFMLRQGFVQAGGVFVR